MVPNSLITVNMIADPTVLLTLILWTNFPHKTIVVVLTNTSHSHSVISEHTDRGRVGRSGALLCSPGQAVLHIWDLLSAIGTVVK